MQPPSSIAPVIETARLRLRGHRPDDLTPRAAMVADGDVVRHAGGLQTREEAWARLQRYVGHWVLFGWGLFAVEDRTSGAFVGEVGLASFERGLGPDFDAAPEAAWVLTMAAAGRGLARESMEAVLAWHDRQFGPRRIVCLIAPENGRSLRLAGHLGFRRFRDAHYHDRAVILLERLPF